MLGRGYPGRSTNVLRLTSTVEAQFVGSYNDGTHNQVLVIDNVAGSLKTSGTATTPPLIHISTSGQGTTFVKLGSLLASATIISAITSFNITPNTGLRVLTATGVPSSTNVYAIVDGGGGAPANIDITIAYHWE